MAHKNESVTTSSRFGRGTYYAFLMLAVLVGWLGVNSGILALGRTPLWRDDALPLYVNFLAWEGQALRDAFASLLAGNGFAFPLYTYSLGYGADTIVTMMGCLNDPLNLIAVFFPPELAEVPYVLLIPVRLVLAAVTFSWFCFERGHDRSATLVGSLCYVFGGYAVFWGILRHANFLNWPIFLPIILLGADRIFAHKSPVMFILGIGFLFFASVYFTYMSCFALLAYCLIKYFFVPRERSVVDFFKLVGRFVLYLLIGFCIGAVFAYPSIIALLSQSRATDGASVSAFFTLSYYAAVGVQSVGGMVTTRGLYEGAMTIVLVLVFVLCGRQFTKKVHRPWLIALVLCWIGILVPFVGHVLNGFGYVSDRWMLIYNFVCAYIACLTVPVLGQLDCKDLKRVAIGLIVIVVWAAFYVAYPIVVSSEPLKSIWPLLMIIALVIAYVMVRIYAKRTITLRVSGEACSNATTHKLEKRWIALLACAVLLGASMNALLDCSPLGSTYVKYFPKFGVAGQDLTSASPAAVIDDIEDDSTFRHTYGRVYNGRKNASLTHGTMGVDFYSSYYNQYVDDYRQELGLCDHYLNYSFVANDSRLALEAISGVKYYVATDEDVWRSPYDFTEITMQKAGANTYHVFQTAHTLPLGFVADSVVGRSAYDKLSMVDKQMALMDGIVVDGADLVGAYASIDVQPTAMPVDYKIEKTDGLAIDGNIIVTKKNNASMVLSFAGTPASETYVVFDDLAFSGHSPVQRAEINDKDITLKTKVQELLWSAPTTYIIDCSIGENHKSFQPATQGHRSYGGKDNWVVNMGYSDEARSTVTISFSTAGTYTFADLDVYCQPVKPIVDRIDELSKGAFDRLELGVNRIEATASLSGDDPQLAFFSFAYTPGWSATVDGEPAMVVRADTAFMAVEVQGAGTHEIVLTYVTPGLEKGAIATIVGLIALVIVVIVRKRRSRHAA